jgi:hypothetical protein
MALGDMGSDVQNENVQNLTMQCEEKSGHD